MPVIAYAKASRKRGTSSTWQASCWKHPHWKSAPSTEEGARRLADEHNALHHNSREADLEEHSRKPAESFTPCSICGSRTVVLKHSRSRKVFLTYWLWAMSKKPHCAQCGAVRGA